MVAYLLKQNKIEMYEYMIIMYVYIIMYTHIYSQ